MRFEMTHFTDLCNWFLQDEPVEVMAMSGGLLNQSVSVRYRRGAMASIVMCGSGTLGYPKELYEVMGQGAIVAVDHLVEVRTAGIAGAPARLRYPVLNDRHPTFGAEAASPAGWPRSTWPARKRRGDPMLQFTAEPDKGHARHLERFVDQVRRSGPEVCGVDDAIQAGRMALAAIESAQTGAAIRCNR